MKRKYEYELKLFIHAKGVLCKMPDWEGRPEITMETTLTPNDINYIFYKLMKKMRFGKKFFENEFQRKYNIIMKRSFEQSTQIPTLRKAIHLFESMFHDHLFLLDIPCKKKHRNKGIKPKPETLTLANMVEFVKKYCSDSIIVHNNQIR